jgi:hypothetical protein
LVTFGLRTNPYQEAGTLLGAVREKLNTHDELWNELRRYREALEPNTQCLHQQYLEGQAEAMYDARGPHKHEWPQSLPRLAEGSTPGKLALKSEAENMREFMAFVVTRLQVRNQARMHVLGAWFKTMHCCSFFSPFCRRLFTISVQRTTRRSIRNSCSCSDRASNCGGTTQTGSSETGLDVASTQHGQFQ